MQVVDRLRMGLETEFGYLLLGLLGLFIVLLLVFAFLAYRQRRRDILAYQYRAHYEQALALVTEFTATTPPKAGFFGRETVGTLSDGRYAWCCIPPPDMATQGVRERFRTFTRATSSQKLAVFAPLLWSCADDLLITIQGRMLRDNGLFLANVQELISDSSFAATEVEDTLLELARALAALHRLKAESGSSLYHGFLLPRSLFVELGPNRSLERFVVADLGMAYALGPKGLHHAVCELEEGKRPMERYAAEDILDQLVFLAPEQRDPGRFQEVGSAVDFYMFAGLAVTLFTRDAFAQLDRVRWEKVPEKWQPFLKVCLNDEPDKRPKDFMELEDWLYDPELALTHEECDVELLCDTVAPGDSLSLEDLAPLLNEMQETMGRSLDSKSVPAAIRSSLDAGETALSQGKWKEAQQQFQAVLKQAADNPEALIGAAICSYEQGNLSAAEEQYQKAKEVDPRLAKRFRNHIAFRV